MNSKSLSLGDFVVVAFPTKKQCRHFLGKILKNVGNDEFDVTFLRKKNKSFSFPLVEDTSLMREVEIMKKLPPPEIRRGLHYFKAKLDIYNL